MKSNIGTLFASILIHNNEIARDTFARVKPEWMTLQIHKDLHQAMNELYKENSAIDMLTMTQKMRELKTLKHEYIIEMSKISNDFGYVNTGSILNACDYEHRVRQMQIISRDLSIEVNGNQMSVDTCIEFGEKIKNTLLFETSNDHQTNEEIIFEVVERHNKAKNGEPLGMELGWSCTRGKIILEEIDVMVVGGRPAMGKTAWMVSAIKKMAFDQNKKVAVMSLEMSKQQIMRRLLAHLTGIDSNKIKLGECTDDEIAKIYSVQNLDEWKNVVIYDGSMSVMDITKNITQMKNDVGCDVYVVDYLQKIIPSKSEQRYQEVTKISNDIKRLTMALKIPCIALAQLSRDSARTGKRPTLPDLKESGEIEQDASVVAFLHRPEYYGETNDENGDTTEGKGEFLIAKNREGVTGIVEMDVDLKTSGWNDQRAFTSPDPAPTYTQSTLNAFAPNDENPF
tara:strand:+ start:17282 stop:18643 length:1362 start_codon:yes stop_codon:yes gene_type:complete